MSRPWTDEDREALLKHHAAGKSLGATAREMDRSSETVHRRGKEAGLSWERKQMTEALEAMNADIKARRAKLRLDLQGDMERLRQQLWSPATVYNFGGKDNTYEEVTLPEPPIVDKLRLMQTITSAATTVERFENMDQEQGIVDARGMLDTIAGAIKDAANKLELEEVL